MPVRPRLAKTDDVYALLDETWPPSDSLGARNHAEDGTPQALHANVLPRSPAGSSRSAIEIHGLDDAAIVLARAQRMARAIPQARWVPIARAGHSSSIEEPGAITSALTAFFDSIANGGHDGHDHHDGHEVH